MKKVFSNKIAAVILAVLTIVSLYFYVTMLAKPITYGQPYYHASVYEGDDFSGTLTFYPDNTMLVENTNFGEPMKSYYYRKDGYLFFTMAETQEEYDAEVAMIDENFEEAVSTPFYAAKLNAFQLTAEGLDEYDTFYYCKYTINLAIAWGIGQLVLIVLTCVACKKANKKKA